MGKKQYIKTWVELKASMKKRFMPTHYRKELSLKIQILRQGVEEYFKEMELLLLNIDLDEDEEAKIKRFLHGLDHDIQEVLELHDHETLESLLHQGTKVEKRIQRRTYFLRHSLWNSSHKEKKEEEKTHQGKYSKPP